MVGSEGLSSLELVRVTNGNMALPAAYSTISKQSDDGGREQRGVIRKENGEQDQTRERNGGACHKCTLKVKRCVGDLPRKL